MEKINESNYLYQQSNRTNNNSNIKKKNETKNITTKKTDSFFDFLKTEEKENEENNLSLQKDQLINLLKDIGKKGEQLKKNLTIENLTEYKKMVKSFLLSAIELSEKVERKSMWNSFKKEKVTKVHVEIVDRELSELTKYFFEEQKDVFKIANKIDKIEGILIDICK